MIARDRLAAERVSAAGRPPVSGETLQEEARRSRPPGGAVGGPLEEVPSPETGPDPGQAPDIPPPGTPEPGPGVDD